MLILVQVGAIRFQINWLARSPSAIGPAIKQQIDHRRLRRQRPALIRS